MKDLFDSLAAAVTANGPTAMLDVLADSLKARRRWHALFDLRLLQARAQLGLPTSGDLRCADPSVRDRLDELSLAACREVGWSLLDEGHVAAAWMYLRAAAEPNAVADRIAALARGPMGDDETAEARRQEILHVALWEGVAPALGITLMIESQGTCNAITAYEQAVTRLPVAQQREPAAVLVDHLSRTLFTSLAADLERRGLASPERIAATASIVELLDAAGGLADDPSFHIDVSHLQSVLRIARVCTERPVIQQAWELAAYACRLPAEVTYPGEPPFENMAEASRLFFAAQLGRETDAAIAYFTAAADAARDGASGTLPADTLVYLLWRIDRPADALRAALQRPSDQGMPSAMQASGMLPSLVELAATGDAIDVLREACRRRGDEITFAATFLVDRHRTRN